MHAAFRRARRAAPLAAGLPALLLVACAAQPRQSPGTAEAAHAASAVAAAPSAAAVRMLAQRIDVRGAHGRLDSRQRQALLHRLSSQGQATLLQRQLAATAAVGEAEVLAGNRVQLLIDGPQTFDSVFRAIEAARRSVLVESYIVEDAQIARRLSELLRRKRAQGLQVAMIYDAIGSFGTDKAYFDELRAAGVQVCAFNPPASVRPRERQPATERDHRKIVAVDRQVAFTGGINISAVYSSGSGSGRRRLGGSGGATDDKTGAGWRDTHVRVQGTAAQALDQLVRQTWQAQGCEGALAAVPPPPAAAAPDTTGDAVLVVPTEPDDDHSRVYALLMAAFDTAQRSIHVTMAYFAPGSDMVSALADAARRGVDVQLVLPSKSDFQPVMLAGQSHYQTLLDAGVQLHEFQGAVLHAKTVVVDGVWSTVGSSNLDYRSFTGNNEINLVVLGEDFGALMQRQFDADVAASRPVTAGSWARRPLVQRLKELGARLLERLW